MFRYYILNKLKDLGEFPTCELPPCYCLAGNYVIKFIHDHIPLETKTATVL